MADAKITISANGQEAAKAAFDQVNESQRAVADSAAGASASTGEAYQSLWDRIKGGANELLGNMGDVGAGIQLAFESPIGATELLFDDFKDKGKELGESLAGIFENPVEGLKNFGSTFQSSVVSMLGEFGPIAEGAIAVAGALGAAIFELGSRADETGASIYKLALINGGSVEGMSDLKFAVEAAGGSIDQFSNSMFMFQNRMENSTDKVDAGLNQIGLSVAALKSMKPDEQFVAISTALRNAGDDVNKAAIAFDIFGRQGRDMLPLLLKPLGDLKDQSAALGYTWSTEDAKAAEEFEAKIKSLGAQTSATWTLVGKNMTAFSEGVSESWAEAQLGAARVVNFFTGMPGWIRDALGEIEGDVKETTEKIAKDFDPATKAAQDWIDKLSDTAKKGIAAAAQNALLEEGLAKLGIVQGEITNGLGEQDKEWEKHQKALQSAIDSLTGLNRDAPITLEALQSVARNGLALGTAEADRFAAAVKKLIDEGVYVPPNLRAIADAERQYAIDTAAATGMIARQEEVTKGLIDRQMAGLPVITDLTGAMNDWAPTIDGVRDTTTGLNDNLQVTWDASGNLVRIWTDQLPGAASIYSDAIQEATNETYTLADAIGDDLNASLEAFPAMMQKALLGKGGIKQAVKAFGSDLGSGIGQSIEDSVSDTLTNTFGDVLGTTLGDMIPVVGSLVGPLLGKLFSFGGPSKEELAGRQAVQDFVTNTLTPLLSKQEQIEAGNQGWAISNIALRDAYISLGDDAAAAIGKSNAMTQQMFAAEKAGPAAVKAVQDQMNAVLDQAKERTTALASGVGAVEAAFKAAGANIPDSVKASITALAQMKGLTDDERTSLLNLTKDVRPNFESLEATAKTYGITLAGLGPKFEQGALEDSAKKVFDDFTALTKAGGDVGGVLMGMKGKIGDLVKESIQFGTAIPDNMKPLIQNLIDAGQLTDANGKKITDMSKLTFEATPINDTLNTLNDTLQKLVDTLQNKLPAAAKAAANSVPDNPYANWVPPSFDVNNPGSYTVGVATGGVITPEGGVDYFDRGGVARRPNPFQPRGTDTVPAMLTPGEGVLNVDDMAAMGGPVGFSEFRRSLHAADVASRPADIALPTRIDTLSRTQQEISHALAGMRAQLSDLTNEIRFGNDTLPTAIRHALRGTA